MDRLKEIQQQLKSDKSDSAQDKKTYEQIFPALDKAPDFELDDNFAASILKKIRQMDYHFHQTKTIKYPNHCVIFLMKFHQILV